MATASSMEGTTFRTSESRTAKASLIFNPFDPRVNLDPYPHYSRLRLEEPIHWSKLGVWFVGRYDDVRAILKDRRFRVRDVSALLRDRDKLVETTQISRSQPRSLSYLVATSECWLAFQEGTTHKRLRGIYASAMHRNFIELLRPIVRDASRALIMTRLACGEMDVMKDFARHLPIHIIGRMVGIPDGMLPLVERWARALTRFVVSFTSLEDLGALDKASEEFMAYLRDAIAQRRRAPGNDLISTFCREGGGGSQPLTEQELISVCVFIVVAGLEAVENLIGNGTLALLRHPNLLRQLQGDLASLTRAVEELARFDTPLQMVMRIALEDVEMGGKVIRSGDTVYLALGSANRDPERFTDPDSLIWDREQNHHLSFGDGHHLCVGAQLARVQGQEAILALLELVPDMRLATDTLNWGRNLLSRGLVALPIQFSAQ
jgi:cytochrome P450